MANRAEDVTKIPAHPCSSSQTLVVARNSFNKELLPIQQNICQLNFSRKSFRRVCRVFFSRLFFLGHPTPSAYFALHFPWPPFFIFWGPQFPLPALQGAETVGNYLPGK
jgi:hypothetical protein